jgi:long-chain acyl-CoA synthetase
MAPSATLVELFRRRALESRSRPALWTKTSGTFTSTSWEEFAERVRWQAAGLVRAGVQPGDRVVQLSENRFEWVVSDLAIQLARAVHVPIHAPLTASQVAWQIVDSGARIVLVSTAEQAGKLQAAAAQLPAELQIYAYDTPAPAGRREIWPLARLVDGIGGAEAMKAEQDALECLGPESLATILYTSGTTGEPKGVMLTQHNLVTNVLGMLETVGFDPQDLRLSFLPLSHVFARTCELYTWLASGSQLALAESRETVLADCAALRPTVLNGVPYFFDHVRRGLVKAGCDRQPGALRDVLGGRIRCCFSGGAALPDELFDFYQAQGVPVLQGYGLTETSPVISVSSEKFRRRGAAGRPIPGVEVRIAPDGEILTRGPHVMQGYYRRPEATAEVIRDGWFHTGDLGRIDSDGYLYITGRKKEIIVTAAGKNVAPVLLESLLTADPLIRQALVIGDDRNYLTALIVPDPEHLRSEIVRRGIAVMSAGEALRHPRVLELYQQRIDERLREVSHYEQIRKFILLDRGFTIERGELTPKLSLRRKVIEANFRPQIESMYGGATDSHGSATDSHGSATDSHGSATDSHG